MAPGTRPGILRRSPPNGPVLASPDLLMTIASRILSGVALLAFALLAISAVRG